MLKRFPTIEQRKPKCEIPAWVISLAGLGVAAFSVALTYIVLAAITE